MLKENLSFNQYKYGCHNCSVRREKERSTVVTISEPGYYRIGAGVHTVGCKSGSFTVVDGEIGQYGFRGGTYAVDMTSTEISRWVRVAPWALNGGSLQFEVSCLEGAEDGQLLVRDMAKESALGISDALGTGSVEQMRTGISLQAQAARAAGASEPGGAAYDRGGWSRGC